MYTHCRFKRLDTRRTHSIAKDVACLIDRGFEVVLVSSGAIAAGMKKLGLREGKASFLQALSLLRVIST